MVIKNTGSGSSLFLAKRCLLVWQLCLCQTIECFTVGDTKGNLLQILPAFIKHIHLASVVYKPNFFAADYFFVEEHISIRLINCHVNFILCMNLPIEFPKSTELVLEIALNKLMIKRLKSLQDNYNESTTKSSNKTWKYADICIIRFCTARTSSYTLLLHGLVEMLKKNTLHFY